MSLCNSLEQVIRPRMEEVSKGAVVCFAALAWGLEGKVVATEAGRNWC